MNHEQFQNLVALSQQPLTIRANFFAAPLNMPARTLLYGYTCERDGWHVYLEEGLIHLHVYKETAGHEVVRYEARDVWPVLQLIPDKRPYPESTEYNFAQMCRTKGIEIPYTVFDAKRAARVRDLWSHGRTYGE